MKRILDGMQKTMMAVKPPRYTALEGLQKAETANPFKILIGTVLSARTKDENTTKAVTGLFKVYNTPQKLSKAKVKDVEKIIKSVGFYHVKSRRIIEVAKIIGIPQDLIVRHPFPGPGLAVRIIGEVTKNKLDITRLASKIVEDELQNAGLYDKVWQAYAAVGDDKAVGVVGDERKYGNIVMIRIVDSIDAMTADWTRLPNELIEKISNRITNEIDDVTWVSYVVSSKPPATIEPQ